MANIKDVVRNLRAQPAYTLMRGIARFGSVRNLVVSSRRILQRRPMQTYLADCESRMSGSQFSRLDRVDFVRRLRHDGVVTGLQLPSNLVEDIRHYADQNPCFADRLSTRGFHLEARARAEAALGKPILVAQYFNARGACGGIDRLLHDPMLSWIAAEYLESVPTFVGANLWWTFPVMATEADRDRHAHLFHRDVDDFRFFKFFFYLTEVSSGDGAHVCVSTSHRRPPVLRYGDQWKIRRYSNEEIEKHFPSQNIMEICGPAGSGFAENTLCIHKGLTPTRAPRLLLQLQFALFDYGVLHDRRDPATLRMIA